MRKLSFLLAFAFLFTSVAMVPMAETANAADKKSPTSKTKKKIKAKKLSKKPSKNKDHTNIDEDADNAKDAKVKDGVACRASVIDLSNDYKKQIADISAQTAGDTASRQALVTERVNKLNKLYSTNREKNKTARDKLYKSLKARANTDEKRNAVDAFTNERDQLTAQLTAKNDAALQEFRTRAEQSAAGASAASQTGLATVTQANAYGESVALAGCSSGKKFSQVRGDYRGTVRAKLTDYRNTTRTGFVDQLNTHEQTRRKAVEANNNEISGKMASAKTGVLAKLKVKKPKTVKKKAPVAKNKPSSTAITTPSNSSAPIVTAPATSNVSAKTAAQKRADAAAAKAAKAEKAAKAREIRAAAAAAKLKKARDAAAKKRAAKVKLAKKSPYNPPTKKSSCFQNHVSGGLVCANAGHNYVCQERGKAGAAAGKTSSNEISGCIKQN